MDMSVVAVIIIASIVIAKCIVIFRWGRNLLILQSSLRALKSQQERDLPLPVRCLLLTGNRKFSCWVEELEQHFQQLWDQEEATARWLEHLAHDMRTPITAMQGYAEIIGTAPTTDTRKVNHQYAHAIVGLGDQLEGMVEDLNQVSRILAGTLEKETLSLAELVFHSLELYKPLMADKGLNLTAPPPANLFLINGDPHLLQRAVQNLLQNATRYTQPYGNIEVVFRQQKGEFICSVTNTTEDSVNQHLARIFERGYSSGKTAGGKGFGLSIVQEIMALHGGSVKARVTESNQITLALHFPEPSPG